MPINNGNPDIYKDGHVDIAHPIAQEWRKYRLSGEEWQILWVIIEKTWGWHKAWDNIPLKQFYEATGMKKPSIIRALRKLIDKNIVSKRANGKLTNYHINSHFDTWKSLAKKLTLTKPLAKELMTVSKRANDISKRANKKTQNFALNDNLQAPKESFTKETIQKKILYVDQKFENITEEKIQKWSEAFPGIDIGVELKEMEVWLMANPKNQKENYERFIVNWLSRTKKGGKDGKNKGNNGRYIPITGKRKFTGLDEKAGEW